MNFTALLPCGLTKDVWISRLPKGTIFTTRRPIICQCGENSLKHIKGARELTGKLICWFPKQRHTMEFAPLPPKLKAGKSYQICSGRGTKAICSICGHKEKDHEIETKPPLKSNKYSRQCYCGCYAYTPLSCELVSVMDEEEWQVKALIDSMFKFADTNDDDWTPHGVKELTEEAHREGFETWEQLDKWITDYYGSRPKLWRYCFKR